MADEELLKQDERKTKRGKPKVEANDGKWTPRTEIRWNKHGDYFASLQWPSFMASLIVN